MPQYVQRVKHEVDMKVCVGLLSAGVPISLLRNRHFCDMLTACAEYGAGYRPPSSECCRSKLALEVEKDLQGRCCDMLEVCTATGGTVCDDGWKDTGGQQVVNGTFVTPKGSMFLRSKNLTAQTKNAPLLAECLEELIEMVGCDRVVQCITDNASNVDAARRMIAEKYPHIVTTGCAAHALDLVIEDLCEEPWAKPTLTEARNLVTFITNHEKVLSFCHKHAVRLDILTKRKTPFQYVKFGETRFATVILVGMRLLKLARSTKAAFNDEELQSYAQKQRWRDAYTIASDTAVDASFWRKLKGLMDVLQPLLILLRLFDSDVPCAGKVYYKVYELGENLKAYNGANKAQRERAYASLIERWRLFHCPTQAAGFALDPEYWGPEYAQEKNDEVMDGFRDMCKHVHHGNPEKAAIAFGQWSAYKDKDGPFGKPDASMNAKRLPAHKWWRLYGAFVPELQTVAMRCLAQVCSSSSTERVNSEGAHIKNLKQNRMYTTTMSRHLYVYHNLRLLDKVCDAEYSEVSVAWDEDSDDE